MRTATRRSVLPIWNGARSRVCVTDQQHREGTAVALASRPALLESDWWRPAGAAGSVGLVKQCQNQINCGFKVPAPPRLSLVAVCGSGTDYAQPLYGGTLTHLRTATVSITECVPEPQYRPLDPEDIGPVLGHYWQCLGLTLDPGHHSDADALLTIVRITGGNF